ncbi:acetate kinase [Enterococcus sp. AZ072]|uniref:acetate kinase n=1 Tax=unclassified Enterococcus TaxID=2608891 RepID=UPI003D2DCF46
MKPVLLPLNEMIDYSAYQIRSRIVSQALNIEPTVVIYALDEGESVSSEKTGLVKLLHILEGKLEVTIFQQKWTAQAGELLAIPANSLHSIQANEKCKYLQIELPERKDNQ